MGKTFWLEEGKDSKMAVQTRTILVSAVIIALVLFAIGIMIGHFAIRKPDTEPGSEYLYVGCDDSQFTEKGKKYKDTFLDKCARESCYPSGDCNNFGLPRTYLAYHLNGKTINMDGILDDEAWAEVPWSDSFVDIRGEDYPTPHFDSKVKVRWDDNRLYIGARMEQTDFWGTLEDDESLVWTENALEVYAVPDGSMHNYKEMQISVKNVTWDLRLKKAYIDGPQCPGGETVVDSDWSSDQEKKTYTDGTINDPNGKGTFWSVEWSFSFEALANYTDRQQPTPAVDEAWFMIFARPEYKFKIVNGQYVKESDADTEWWVWQPTYTVNLHLPSRFGLMQFKRDLKDTTFYYKRWHIYRALFEMFDAMHKYKSLNGMFITELDKIGVPPYMMSTTCTEVIIVSANGTDFEVTARSRIDNSLPIGHIRRDRYVWFT